MSVPMDDQTRRSVLQAQESQKVYFTDRPLLLNNKVTIEEKI